MKFRIGKELGKKFIKVESGDGWINAGHAQSAELTGANTHYNGIFNANATTFTYGEEDARFNLSDHDLFEKGHERENLIARIKMVREWVQSLDYAVEFELE